MFRLRRHSCIQFHCVHCRFSFTGYTDHEAALLCLNENPQLGDTNLWSCKGYDDSHFMARSYFCSGLVIISENKHSWCEHWMITPYIPPSATTSPPSWMDWECILNGSTWVVEQIEAVNDWRDSQVNAGNVGQTIVSMLLLQQIMWNNSKVQWW